jgi:tetratricopeptide (TPR) repeat protein
VTPPPHVAPPPAVASATTAAPGADEALPTSHEPAQEPAAAPLAEAEVRASEPDRKVRAIKRGRRAGSPQATAEPAGEPPGEAAPGPRPEGAAATEPTAIAAAPVREHRAPTTAIDPMKEAERLLAQGEVANACKKGEEQKTMTPRLPSIYKFLGKCYMRAGQPERAKDAYRRYLELWPEAPDAAFIKSIVR